MRPIRPEPSERVRIKRAMRAARFMKWGANPLAGLGMIVAIAIGATTTRYIGILTFIAIWGTIFLYGYNRARCPRCGQVWWSGMTLLFFMPWWFVWGEIAWHEDETESFVCRRCSLDIGMGLRE